MNTFNIYFLPTVLTGIIGVLCFWITLQSVPELNGQSLVKNESENKIINHIHTSLNVTLNEDMLLVPNGIGINSTLWNDHSLDKYGTKSKSTTFGVINPAMSPLHTHDSSGIIHVESTEIKNYTLGQFLQIWGINLENRIVALLVDGNPANGYSNHTLSDNERLTLIIRNQR